VADGYALLDLLDQRLALQVRVGALQQERELDGACEFTWSEYWLWWQATTAAEWYIGGKVIRGIFSGLGRFFRWLRPPRVVPPAPIPPHPAFTGALEGSTYVARIGEMGITSGTHGVRDALLAAARAAGARTLEIHTGAVTNPKVLEFLIRQGGRVFRNRFGDVENVIITVPL